MLMRSVAVIGCLLVAGASARAAVIDGTFAGAVSSGQRQLSDGSFQDLTGSPVTGAFHVNQIDSADQIQPSNYIVPTGSFNYSLNFPNLNQAFSFGSNSGTENVLLFDNGTLQTVILTANYASGRKQELTLTGPEGSLFSSVSNISSLHAGPGVMVAPLFYGDRFSGFSVDINVTSTTISTSVAQNVPEPPGLAMFGVCLLALAVVLPAYGAAGRYVRGAG